MARTLQVRPLFSADEIDARIQELASAIDRDVAGSPLAIVCIAEGAVRFTEALGEALVGRGMRIDVHPVQVHRTRGVELGALQIAHFDPTPLEERDVLVVDDVADEGRTLRAVLELVELADCRSVRTAVLVDKRERRIEPLRLDYVGFVVEHGWVVGFGMDVDGELRDLDDIGVVVDGGSG